MRYHGSCLLLGIIDNARNCDRTSRVIFPFFPFVFDEGLKKKKKEKRRKKGEEIGFTDRLIKPFWNVNGFSAKELPSHKDPLP